MAQLYPLSVFFQNAANVWVCRESAALPPRRALRSNVEQQGALLDSAKAKGNPSYRIRLRAVQSRRKHIRNRLNIKFVLVALVLFVSVQKMPFLDTGLDTSGTRPDKGCFSAHFEEGRGQVLQDKGHTSSWDLLQALPLPLYLQRQLHVKCSL